MISVYLLLDWFTAGYKKEAAPILTQPLGNLSVSEDYSSIAACAAARRAIGTRKGEHEA